MSGRRLLFAQVLDEGDAPLALYKYLVNKWTVPKASHEFTASLSLCSNMDYTTRAISNTVFPVLKSLVTIVLMGVEGLDKLSLLAVNEDSLVSVLRSCFRVGRSTYKDGPGKLFAIRGEITAEVLTAIMRLKAIHFAANSSFVGTPRL